MAKLVAAEIIVPRDLGAEDKERLIQELYDLHTRIFDGVDRASFVAYVVDSKAEHTWIRLYRDACGALAGYLAVHVFERLVRGRKTAIFRGETGTLREHRGANLISAFFADRLLRYMAANPGVRLCYLGSLVHPSSYAQLARYVDGVWPRPGHETPAETLALMDELGSSFGLARVKADPLVRKVGWRTIDSRLDRAYWEGSQRPGVQFFLRANPGYEQGHGLLTLVPLTLLTVARGLARYGLARAAKSLRELGATLQTWCDALLSRRPEVAC